MKKIKLLLFICILFLPFMVNAKTCDYSSIKLESIELNKVIGNAEEVNEPILNGKKISLDLKLYDPGDSIEYSIKVKNESTDDLYFDEDSLKLNTDYLEYEFIYEDNSNFIKSNSEKIVKLRVNYKNKVPFDALTNEVFNDTNNMVVNLSNKDTIINPETGRFIIKYLFIILIIIGFLLSFVKKNKIVKLMILVGGIIIIPLTVNALCKIDIELESKIVIDGKEAYFLTGPEVNIKMKQLAGNDTSANNEKTVDTNITAILFSENEPDAANKNDYNIVSLSDSPHPIYMWYDNGIIYCWSEDKSPNMHENSSFMFNRFSNLVDIMGLQYFDSQLSNLFQSIFAANSSITSYSSLSKWNTSSVTNMQGAFGGNSILEALDGLENWNVSNAVYMNGLFSTNVLLRDIKALKNWDVSSVEDMSYMFQVDIALESLDGLEKWDVSNVKNMYGMFMGHSSMGDMKIASLAPLRKWDISKLNDMGYMFQRCTKLENLDGLEKWDPKMVSNMQGVFYNDTLLTDISALKNWNTSSVTNMRAMFQFDESLQSLVSLKNWDVSNVTTLRSMFSGCTNLTNVDSINNWDINRNVEFYQMFNAVSRHPEFTIVSGTWDSDGTFIPD